MLILIYHYIDRIGEFSLPTMVWYNVYYHQKYYPGEPVDIYIQELINITQDKNLVITRVGLKIFFNMQVLLPAEKISRLTCYVRC